MNAPFVHSARMSVFLAQGSRISEAFAHRWSWRQDAGFDAVWIRYLRSGHEKTFLHAFVLGSQEDDASLPMPNVLPSLFLGSR